MTAKTKKKPGPGRRFPKGTRGNPTGCPVGSRNKTTLAAQELLDGEAEALTRTEALELLPKPATAENPGLPWAEWFAEELKWEGWEVPERLSLDSIVAALADAVADRGRNPDARGSERLTMIRSGDNSMLQPARSCGIVLPEACSRQKTKQPRCRTDPGLEIAENIFGDEAVRALLDEWLVPVIVDGLIRDLINSAQEEAR